MQSLQTASIDAPAQQPRTSRPDRQAAVVAFLRTAGLIEERLSRAVEPGGISFQQYVVLRILRGAGEGGLATLTIAEQMMNRSPGITRLVDRLERQSLVSRARGRDRRQVLCLITPKGLELLASLDGQVDAADAAVFATLTHNEVAALVHFLDRVRGTLS